MIEVPTVLVLGAGASTDYGYPTGPVLREQILDGLADDDRRMYKQLKGLGHSCWGIDTFREKFTDNQLPTVDQFLEGHSEFADVGKHAIACALLPYEESWRLERRSQPKWYDYLWDELRRDIENFTDNKLTIVTFNYDRSLEQYLGRALEVSGADQVPEKLFSLGFIHVYGTLGGKPYIDEGARKYGDTGESRIVPAANAIKIIDRKDDEELLSQFKLAKKALSEAKRVVMLGFGYEATNVERLGLREIVQGGADVIGTALGMPTMRLAEVQRITGLRPRQLRNVNCRGMFDDNFSFR